MAVADRLGPVTEAMPGANEAYIDLDAGTTHDEVTGLASSGLFLYELERALDLAARTGSHVATIALEVHRIEPMLDTLPVDGAARLLVEIADRLRRVVRPSDVVARRTRGRFSLMLQDLDAIDGAMAVADRITQEFERPVDIDGEQVHLEFNMGVTLCGPRAGATQLVSEADTALDRAIRAAPGKVEIFDDEMRAWMQNRRGVEHGLHDALDLGHLRLYYQPIIDVAQSELVAFEALLRWERPGIGLVGPDAFLEVAEESGLILPVGRWVLYEACRQLAEWSRARPGAAKVAVNISARQLLHPGFFDALKGAVRTTGAPARGLMLEVTERDLLDHLSLVLPTLHRIRELGVGMVLDDFGTGYSSLTCLRQLPLTCVKVDEGFVHELPEQATTTSMVELVAAVAKALNIKVVAEAVERPSELRALESLGCDWAQGYLISEPVPPDRATAMFEDFELSRPQGDLEVAFPTERLGNAVIGASAATRDNPVVEV